MRRLVAIFLMAMFQASAVQAVQYTGFQHRDPFTDPERQSDNDREGFSVRSLNLEGFVWNSGKPQAIINGKVVKEGGKIGDAEVLQIGKDGVKMRYRGQEFLLKRRSIVNK
jgi:hypothetical protein